MLFPEDPMVATWASDHLAAVSKNPIDEFCSKLGKAVYGLPQQEQDTWKRRAVERDGERLIEDAFRQASRNVDPEKLEMIAALVKNSLSGDQLATFQARRLLRILDDLDEVDLIILQSYTKQNAQTTDFAEKHKAVFECRSYPSTPELLGKRYYGSYEGEWLDQFIEKERLTVSNEDRLKFESEVKKYQLAVERGAIFTSRESRLIEIGLIGDNYSKISDVTMSLTPLGTALLKIIDLADDDEFGTGEQANITQAMQYFEEAKQESDKRIDELASNFPYDDERD